MKSTQQHVPRKGTRTRYIVINMYLYRVTLFVYTRRFVIAVISTLQYPV